MKIVCQHQSRLLGVLLGLLVLINSSSYFVLSTTKVFVEEQSSSIASSYTSASTLARDHNNGGKVDHGRSHELPVENMGRGTMTGSDGTKTTTRSVLQRGGNEDGHTPATSSETMTVEEDPPVSSSVIFIFLLY